MKPRPRPVVQPATEVSRLRVLGDLRLSPEGKRAVFVTKTIDVGTDSTHHQLVLLHLDTGRTQELSHSAGSDTQPCWSPDGRNLYFVSDREGTLDLWRLEFPRGCAERLTRLGGRVLAPQVDGSGQRLAFLFEPAPAPPTALSGLAVQVAHWGRNFPVADPRTGRVGERFLCLLDLRTRRVRRLTTGKRIDRQFTWAPHGKALAFTSTRLTLAEAGVPQDELDLVDLRRGTSRLLVKQHGLELAPAWSPDGKHIAYLGHEAKRAEPENVHLWVVLARGGTPRDLTDETDLMCAPVSVTDTLARRDMDLQPPVWSPDGRSLTFLASRGGSVNVFQVRLDGGPVRERTRGRHEIASISRSANGKVWAYLRRDATDPGEVVVAAEPSGRRKTTLHLRRVTRLHAGASRRLVWRQPEEFHVDAAPGGHRIHGFLWRAHGGRRRGPAVLVLHDGPGMMVGHSFVHEFHLLAAAGYHVVCANLRGSAGYGAAFLQALRGTWGFEDLKDVHTLADWMASRSFVDHERLGLMGQGYGGFLTAWTIGHTPRFRCAVSDAGPAHFASYFGTSAAGAELQAEFLAPPWESHERYWRTSPLAFVGLLRTPLLLLQGDGDGLCPPSQSQELFQALRLQGRDVEMVQFLGEEHDFIRHGRPSSRIERWHRILDWFERKL